MRFVDPASITAGAAAIAAVVTALVAGFIKVLKALREIHVAVNSNMTAALAKIDKLQAEIDGIRTGMLTPLLAAAQSPTPHPRRATD